MATTAKLRGSNFPDSGEEDIAAIAKQISDHAEAIYQTWKSRGLAPTEILNCHSNDQAADQFGSTLTPQSSPKSPVVELLHQTQHLDNNNLEKFVNNFVVEDKARMAARQKSPAKSLPTSIQFALQKFENNSSFTPPPKTKSPITPSSPKPQILQKPQISPKPVFRQEMAHTIETILPAELKPNTPKRPTYFNSDPQSTTTLSSNNSSPTGLQTWPLKNKQIDSPTKKGVKAALEQLNPIKDPSSYLDEVAKEEERLINALKTGVIIAEDRTTPERILKQKFSTPIKENSDRPLSKDHRNDLSNMSIVDYAKVRYRAAQQNPSDARPSIDRSESPAAAIVSRVRNKFEPPNADQIDVVDLSTRWSLRPRPRNNVNGNVSDHHQNVPHPELTSSQRQHIRAAAATNNALCSGNNPVRPFLTRGSVAERVLIFEKCPSELLLDKRSRTAPAINTWRTGHEVHHKAQVSFIQ